MGIIKLANEQKENKQMDDDVKAALSAGLIAGSGAVANKGVDRVTGLERMYHSTDKRNINSIKESGLQASRANSSPASVGAGIHTIPESEGKVYVGRKKGAAKGVATMQEMQDPKFRPGMVNVRIPYEDLKTGKVKSVKNPELRGLENSKDFADYLILRNRNPQAFAGGDMTAKEDAKRVKDLLQKARDAGELDELGLLEQEPHLNARFSFGGLDKGTLTVDGDLPSKYIKGGKGSDSLYGVRDWGRYVKNNKGRFATGLGITGLGLGGVGLGGAGVYQGVKGDSE